MGGMEILVILLIALILLGPEKMPEVVRTLARVVREIRRVGDEVRMHLDPDLDLYRASYPDFLPPARTGGGLAGHHDAQADGSLAGQPSDRATLPNPSPEKDSQLARAPDDNPPLVTDQNPASRDKTPAG